MLQYKANVCSNLGDVFIFLQQVLSASKNVGDSGQVHTQKDIMWLLTTAWKVHGFGNPIISEQMTFSPYSAL